jgi:hypothetical protein
MKKEYKILKLEFGGMATPKVNINEMQAGINEYAKEGWTVEHITPLANVNGITGSIVITLSKEV